MIIKILEHNNSHRNRALLTFQHLKTCTFTAIIQKFLFTILRFVFNFSLFCQQLILAFLLFIVNCSYCIPPFHSIRLMLIVNVLQALLQLTGINQYQNNTCGWLATVKYQYRAHDIFQKDSVQTKSFRYFQFHSGLFACCSQTGWPSIPWPTMVRSPKLLPHKLWDS